MLCYNGAKIYAEGASKGSQESRVCRIEPNNIEDASSKELVWRKIPLKYMGKVDGLNHDIIYGATYWKWVIERKV